MAKILLIGSFDTKGDEYAYVAELIRVRGHEVLMMDFGVMESGSDLHFDISASRVAEEGGTSLDILRAKQDRGLAMQVMTSGARAITRQFVADDAIDGILGMGGGGGSTVISAAMRELPVGIPKLLVSTMASGDTTRYVDIKDLTLMYSVVDIAGLNPLSRRILANAAGAICGMVETAPPAVVGARPVIATTMFGVTTPCVTMARKKLEQHGYDVLVFHATGSGGRAMEGLIDDGFVAGVLDINTTEWCDEVAGGVLSAGPDRLGAAARIGIPQVVSVGALDMVNFGAFDTVPQKYQERSFYRHNETVTLMRTTPNECAEIGRRIAGQLSRASAPVTLLLPLRGVSMIDAEGQPFFDPDADHALFDSLRQHCGPGVTIRELDSHINNPAFANALADEMLALMASHS